MEVTGAGVLLLLCVFSILLFTSFKMYKKRGQLPPGPTPWFLLGNLLQKDVFPLHASYEKLIEKYGPIFTVWTGPKPMVVLCGYEVVKDALVGHAEEFGGRPVIPLSVRLNKGRGLVSSPEPRWRELRRFTLSTLRDFGMGKKSMSERVQEEARCLVEEMATTQGQAFDPRKSITCAVSNVICSVVFGNRLDYKDPNFLESIELMDEFLRPFQTFFGLTGLPSLGLFTIGMDLSTGMNSMSGIYWITSDITGDEQFISTTFPSPPSAKITQAKALNKEVLQSLTSNMMKADNLYSSLPKIMEHLPGPHQKILANGEKFFASIKERVESHRQIVDPQNPRDYIDCFLMRLEKEQSSTNDMYTIEDLVMSVFGLFTAGTGSTSLTLLHSLIVMTKFPDIQAKVQHEIDEVVGANRLPSMEDRMKMPFTNAVVHELLRYQKGIGETFPREMTRHTEFRSYTIPQGTAVLALLVSVHFDPLHWETPYKFNPGHFLDAQGQFRKRDAFMAFSAGKRQCPGEALARMELFLLFSTLLQNFTFQMAADPKEDTMSLYHDFVLRNLYPSMRAIRRHM